MFQKLIDLVKRTFVGKYITKRVMLRKIRDWQHRESVERAPLEDHAVQSIGLLSAAQVVRNEAIAHFKYVTDTELFHKKDYWETSKVAKQNRKGDCDGFSVYVWGKLMDQRRFNPCSLGMIVFDGHMCASVVHGGEFWVIDNGYITHKVCKLSSLKDVLRVTKIRPLLWFNMTKIYHL